MKRMRFFAVISILLFSLVGGFSSPQNANAQTPLSTFTHEQAKEAVIPLFDALITIVNQEVATASKLTSTAGVARYAQYQTTGPALIAFTNTMRDAYNSAYDASLTPAKAQLKAIAAVQTLLNNQPPALVNGINKIPGLSRMTIGTPGVFRTQLEDARVQANEIDLRGDAGALTSSSSALINAQKDVDKAVAASEESCGSIVLNFTKCLTAGVVWIIKTVFLNIAGFFIWAAANMLNYAIQVGILDFAKWAPASLYPIWLIIRQIVSLFIIFAGLWLGFMYIINKGDQFKKYIPWVVIFALFVNFSYPLTRTVVDISNVVSLNLYGAAVGNQALEAGSSPTSQATAGGLIMNRLGLEKLVMAATTNEKSNNSASLTNTNTIAGSLLVVAFVLYAAWIFFIVTWLIITRTAALVFIIIASPLLFVDAVIPKLGDYAKQLRGIFWEMLFVAPVFMVMLALTLKFLEVFSSAGIGKVGSFTGGDKTIVEFFNILLMLIMLHIMFKVTKATSGAIGGMVTGVMGKVGGMAVGGVALGGAGFLGRQTLGRGASWVRSKASDMEQKGGAQGFVGKHMFNASNAVANSSFDARNSAVVRTNAEKIGMRLSPGNSMGYDARIDKDASDKRIRTNFANTYKNKKENRVREDFNAIGDTDVEGKKKFLNNLGTSNPGLQTKITDDEARKVLAKYKEKEYDTTTKEGKAANEKFIEDHSKKDVNGKSNPLDEAIVARVTKYEEKLQSDREEKTAQQVFRKDSLDTNKALVAAINTQNAQRLGGGNSQVGRTSERNEAEANKTTQNKGVPLITYVGEGASEQTTKNKAPINSEKSSPVVPIINPSYSQYPQQNTTVRMGVKYDAGTSGQGAASQMAQAKYVVKAPDQEVSTSAGFSTNYKPPVVPTAPINIANAVVNVSGNGSEIKTQNTLTTKEITGVSSSSEEEQSARGDAVMASIAKTLRERNPDIALTSATKIPAPTHKKLDDSSIFGEDLLKTPEEATT